VSLASTRPSDYRGLHRRLSTHLAGLRHDAADSATLESQRAGPNEPPRLTRAKTIEPGGIAAHAVVTPSIGIAAFLDGIQASRVVGYDGTVPIVHGSVGAVIRHRHDRRLGTWQSLGEERLYAPRALLSRDANRLLDELGVEIVDTTRRRHDGSIDDDAHHPLNLAEVAVMSVQGHREAAEIRLAEAWSARGEGILYMDGGVSGSRSTATSGRIIGVVKSHRTLYGDPAAIRVILSLAEGHRSSVFEIEVPDGKRSPVSSWYLRLRDSAGHDPLWGLVRVEVPLLQPSAAGDRADVVSSWVLGESAPVALPDGRWDTMAYGIRDCEQYLRSIA
jgi:hypothetical protein